MNNQLKRDDWVHFWWSVSNVYGAKFIKWVVCRMGTGGDDTNKLGVGALLESSWLFDKIIIPKVPHGCKRGQYILRPYTPIYRSNIDAWNRQHPISRPTVEQVRDMEQEIEDWVPWPWS